VSTHPTSGILTETEVPTPAVSQRITGKLLATHGYVVGIEISSDGARQSVALADLDGNILYRLRRPLEQGSSHATATVLAHLNEMLNEVLTSERLKDGRVLRSGIAVGGLVNSRLGIVQTLHHAQGWENFPLQDYFAEHLAAPCIIDNNANAAGLAEVVRGAGTGERGVLYVGLGRGIGGGLVVNGRIYHGTTSTAGEIGHLLVKEGGSRCSCGIEGHLETIASAQAIVQTIQGLAVEYPETAAAIRRVSGEQPGNLTAAHVFQMAAEGDPLAQRVVRDVHTYLGIALANIVHLINPSMIILGGQVALAKDRLIVPLREHIQKCCLPSASSSLRVVTGSLGSEANLVGAVTLALQDL
jgi:glucokinase